MEEFCKKESLKIETATMKQQEICRTCLKTNESYQNIFENVQNNKLISELIMECVPITIQREEKLSNNICKVCLEKLNSLLDFREMVMKSNDTLLQRLRDDKSDEKGMELRCEIKKELEINEAVVYPLVDVGENNKDCQNQIDIGDIEDEIENTQADTDFVADPNENIPEELYLNDIGTLGESNECDRDSDIVENILENVPNRLGKRNYYEKQLKVILDNPDCKRIVESNLNRQEKSHAKVLCQYCNKSVSFRYFVEVHAHTHMGNVPFKCEFCDYRTPVKSRLRRHMQIHSQTKNILCTQCGKAFATKHLLKLHEQIHSNSTPFKCNICGKGFKHLASLRNHDLVHRDVRKFVCDECGKSFRQKIDLSNHKAIHTNEKKFECPTCSKKFLLKQRLKKHIARHLGLTPFACDICGKKFTVKRSLQQHVFIHTGEKPFSCEVCGKKFRQRACIRGHMRIHTGETPYPCTICSQSFKFSHHLMNHMQRHESNKNSEECENKKTKTEKKRSGKSSNKN